MLQSPFAFIFLMSLAFVMSTSHASPICDGYRKNEPRMYELYCRAGSSSSTKPAGAGSTFSESFKLNPASLPTESSPFGLEVISTFLRNGAAPGFPTLAIIKGFHRIGTGISTASANTFYSNPIKQRLTGPSNLETLDEGETKLGHLTNLNLGTSFLIADPSWGPSLNLGLSARYNQLTGSWGGGPAVLFSTSHFSWGAGISREQVSNVLPRTTFFSWMVSARVSILELECDVLNQSTQAELSPVQILSANLTVRNFMLTAAIRQLNYLKEGNVTQTHFAIQVLLGNHLSVAYLYNFIPGGNSLGVQGYF